MLASPFLLVETPFKSPILLDYDGHIPRFESLWTLLVQSPFLLVFVDENSPISSSRVRLPVVFWPNAGGFSAMQRGGSSCGCKEAGSLLGFLKGGNGGNRILVEFPLGDYQIMGIFLWFHNDFFLWTDYDRKKIMGILRNYDIYYIWEDSGDITGDLLYYTCWCQYSIISIHWERHGNTNCNAWRYQKGLGINSC